MQEDTRETIPGNRFSIPGFNRLDRVIGSPLLRVGVVFLTVAFVARRSQIAQFSGTADRERLHMVDDSGEFVQQGCSVTVVGIPPIRKPFVSAKIEFYL